MDILHRERIVFAAQTRLISAMYHTMENSVMQTKIGLLQTFQPDVQLHHLLDAQHLVQRDLVFIKTQYALAVLFQDLNVLLVQSSLFTKVNIAILRHYCRPMSAM